MHSTFQKQKSERWRKPGRNFVFDFVVILELKDFFPEAILHFFFCHSIKQPLMLPSRVIGNVLFSTYEVMITSMSYSSALMSERIKCSIPLVDSHINIRRAIHAVC